MQTERMRIGVLASHEGTTLQAVLDACASGRLRAVVAVVVSNNRDSAALRRARLAGMPAVHLSGATHPDEAALDGAILDALAAASVDLVLLGGYMRKLGPLVRRAFAGRILNTHPALLPKFGGQGMYGSRVHEAVLAAGETETGVTIHLVDADYDTGPIVAQARLPVHPGETPAELAARVQADERELVIRTLVRIASGELVLPMA